MTTTAPSIEPATVATGHAAMLRPMLRTALIHVAPSLAAVYALRAAGASPYWALLAGTIVAGIPVVYGIVKQRRLDPVSGYLMLFFGLGLLVALVTSDPQLILAGQTAVNGLFGVAFLVSAAIGKPLTEIAAAQFMPAAGLDSSMRDTLHGLHRRISIVVGVALITEVTARLIIIFTTPFDVANGLVSVIGGMTFPLVAVAVMVMVQRFKAAQKATQAG
jgi:hypothetical protein